MALITNIGSTIIKVMKAIISWFKTNASKEKRNTAIMIERRINFFPLFNKTVIYKAFSSDFICRMASNITAKRIARLLVRLS